MRRLFPAALVVISLVVSSCAPSQPKDESTITLADVVDFQGMQGWEFVHRADQEYKTIQASVIQYTNGVDGQFRGEPLLEGTPYTGALRNTDTIKVIFQWQDGHARGNLRYSEPRTGASTKLMPQVDSRRLWIGKRHGCYEVIDGETLLMADFTTNPVPAWEKKHMKAYISVKVTTK